MKDNPCKILQINLLWKTNQLHITEALKCKMGLIRLCLPSLEGILNSLLGSPQIIGVKITVMVQYFGM
ncbi:hypothetical protein D3C75_1320600 [compost metagenome]